MYNINNSPNSLFSPQSLNLPPLHFQPNPQQLSFKCTVIVLQPHDIESSHIRLTQQFDTHSTAYLFKEKLYKHLHDNHSHELHHKPEYYSCLGITNDDLSPHDIFEV